MPVYKIWSLGSTEFDIEEGGSVEVACKKAGKKRQDCEVQLIPEESISGLKQVARLVQTTGSTYSSP